MNAQAPVIVMVGIPALALLALGLFIVGCRRVLPRRWPAAALGGALWFALSAGLAASGLLARFDARPPPIVPFMVGALSLGLGLGLSPLGRRLAAGWPLAALIGVQALRLPLELVMHRAAAAGVMPVQMSFPGLDAGRGWNFDLVTGALALPVAWLIGTGRAPRALAWLWNGLGVATLAGVLAIAVASTPLLHAFGAAPARLNTWVAYVPFVWLPAGPVVFALLGHVVIARKLYGERAGRAGRAAVESPVYT